MRLASVIIVLGQGLAFLLSALLPATEAADRSGLLLGAGLTAIAGALWFLVLPRDLLGSWRVFVACLVAEGTVFVTLATTGGLRSSYFSYYLLPLLVMVMAGSRMRTLLLGAVTAAGLIGLGVVANASAADHETLRDLFVVALLQVLTFTIAATAASRAMGAITAALAAQTRMLADQTRSDPLTGLGNRKALTEGLARALSAADRRGVPLSVIALDVDGLKLVNDVEGHGAGDRLLNHLADLLRQNIRGQDQAVRVGGDEFVLLLPDTDADGARRLVERIRTAASLSYLDVRFSAGTATSGEAATASQLLARADEAMYVQKSARLDLLTTERARSSTRSALRQAVGHHTGPRG